MKVIIINTPDGRYSLPLLTVAENRAEYYAKGSEEDFKQEVDYVMHDNFEGIDWLLNNCNYEDFEEETTKMNDTVLVLADDFWTSSEDFNIMEIEEQEK